MPRLPLGPLLAALAVVSFLLPSVAEAEVSGSQTFYPAEGAQSFVVPEGVHDLAVSARGASGVQIDTAGTAGLGAIASGTFGVTPGETLLIYVADGDSDGYAEGGSHGKVAGSPKDGGAGGGSSAVIPPSGGPFVIAGGGGGAGGDYHDTIGGAGGNAGTPLADPGQPGRFMEDGEFIQENTEPGCGGCAGEEEGGDGDSDYNWVTSGGGGGGGGAGAEGGNGGQHGYDDGTDESGAGGGGGSSAIRSDAFAPSYALANGCQGQPEPACEGLVTISWGAPGASISPVAGTEQSQVLGGEFDPIAVRVTDAAGYSLEGVPVTFAAPTIGPGGTFPGGGPSVVAETDSTGVATLTGLGTKAPAGRWNLEASVPGGAAAQLPLANQPVPTDVALESTPDPSTAAETPVISAHVEPTVDLAGLTPTGSLQFEFEGVPTGEPVALDPSTGTATLPTASVPSFDAGKRAIDVHYLGDSSYAASEDGIVQTVLLEPTAVGVEGQPNPVSSGSPLTLRATIETRPSSVPPTGIVSFASDGTALGSASVDGSGVATLQLASLPLGTHTVVASYGGDARFEQSTGEMSEVVDEAAVAAVLTSSSNPSTYGTPPRIEAQIQRAEPGPTPTGTVDFSVDGQVACATVALTAGSAGCDLAEAVPAGNHRVTAAFVPAVGSQDKPTTGSMRQVVVAAVTSDALTATPTKAIFGAPFALASTVLRADGVAATGSVGFQFDGHGIGAPVGLVSGRAALAEACAGLAPSPCPLGIGLHRVHSEFVPGDGNLRPSQATAYVHVEPSPTTTAVGLATVPSANSPVSFVAAITAPDRRPEGRVQFLLDDVALGAPVAIGAGTATSPQTGPLAPGPHLVVAHYLETELFDNSEASFVFGVPAPVPPTPPSPRLQPLSRKARLTPDGSLSVPVACEGSSGICEGDLELVMPSAHDPSHTALIARTRLRLGADRSTLADLELLPAVRHGFSERRATAATLHFSGAGLGPIHLSSARPPRLTPVGLTLGGRLARVELACLDAGPAGGCHGQVQLWAGGNRLGSAHVVAGPGQLVTRIRVPGNLRLGPRARISVRARSEVPVGPSRTASRSFPAG